VKGELEEAAEVYRKPIDTYPTAGACTFLGWMYGLMGDYDAAIAECHCAIATDPEFGNSYNDIGAYLIEKGQIGDPIPWLEKATRSSRYDKSAFPCFNPGRVSGLKHDFRRALACYRGAVELDPSCILALSGIPRLEAIFN
jgi:tetratricopeptide (TPR) repeat protein